MTPEQQKELAQMIRAIKQRRRAALRNKRLVVVAWVCAGGLLIGMGDVVLGSICLAVIATVMWSVYQYRRR